MKTRHLFVSFVLGLGLALGLLWALNGWPTPVTAAPVPDPVREPMSRPLQGGVITVCLSSGVCDYDNIQAAVDAASDGDVIKVAAGVYTGTVLRLSPPGYQVAPAVITQVVYISKSLTIRGGYTVTNWTTSYPLTQPTTLDAEGQGGKRVIVVGGGNVTVKLENLRITGGDASGLGGGPLGYYTNHGHRLAF